MTKIFINAPDRSVLRLLFLIYVNILSGCPIINICVCHQDLKLLLSGHMGNNPRTRFCYSEILTYLSYDYGSFSNISCFDLVGSGYRQVLNCERIGQCRQCDSGHLASFYSNSFGFCVYFETQNTMRWSEGDTIKFFSLL